MRESFTKELIALKNPDERQRIIQQQLVKTTQNFLRTLLGITINTIGIITIFFSGKASNDQTITLLCIIITIVGIITITLGTTILLYKEKEEQ